MRTYRIKRVAELDRLGRSHISQKIAEKGKENNMKLITTNNGKKVLKISKIEWKTIGERNKWHKQAQQSQHDGLQGLQESQGLQYDEYGEEQKLNRLEGAIGQENKLNQNMVNATDILDVTEEAKTWTFLTPDDDCLYHVTLKKYANKIIKNGFKIGNTGNDSGTIKGGALENYSKNKLFFTEKSGVSYWIDRIEQHLFHSYDNPPDIAVLKINKTQLNKYQLKNDEVGSTDAQRQAWYIEK